MDYPFNGPLKNGRMRDKNELYNRISKRRRMGLNQYHFWHAESGR